MLVYYGMTLLNSVKLETSGGGTIEYIENCHPNLLMCKLLTSTDDEYDSGYDRNQENRDSHFKGDNAAAERGHMFMMVKTRDRFGFVNDLEMIIHGLGFKLKLKRNNNARALFREEAGAGAVANDGNIDISDKSCCVPSIDPSNDKRIILQKRIKKKNDIDFSYYERKTFYKNAPNATNSYLILLGKVVRKKHNIKKLVLKLIMLMNKLMMQVHLI